VKSHVVKFNHINKVDISLPLTNNQDTKIMVWRPSNCTNVNIKETQENRQRLLSAVNFAPKNINLRRINSTNQESSETFESDDVQQVIRELINMSESERIKILQEAINEEMITLEDAIFVLKTIEINDMSTSQVIVSNEETFGTSVKSKNLTISSIKSFINSIKSQHSFCKHSNKLVSSNCSLMSDVTKLTPRTEISQKNMQIKCSPESMTNGDLPLLESKFSNKSCYKLESNAVSFQEKNTF